MAIECDDFQITVLIDQVEYKKQRNYGGMHTVTWQHKNIKERLYKQCKKTHLAENNTGICKNGKVYKYIKQTGRMSMVLYEGLTIIVTEG